MYSKYFYAFACIMLLLSCSENDSNPIETVLEGNNRGAVLRTVNIQAGEFELGNPESTVSITIEEQDEEDGNLLDRVEVFVAYRNSADGQITNEVPLEIIDEEAFIPGGEESLPRFTLNYSLNTILNVLQMPLTSLQCKDQILIRLELVLSDGRTLSVDDLSAIIAGQGTFFNSPFCYTINIVEPLDSELFTGTYFYESVSDGPFGPTFVPPGLVQITNGHSSTFRNVNLRHNLAEPQVLSEFEFSVVCDEAVVTKLLFAGEEAICAGGGALLFGPDTVNAILNPNDDSVFEVQFVEGFRGFNGQCGFSNAPSRIRFSRQ